MSRKDNESKETLAITNEDVEDRGANVFGEPLQSCCFDPLTGYMRDGFCQVPRGDYGNHSVCAIMTEEFLAFSKARGNDLSTPEPDFDFPGLKEGDKWCLCASRFQEALEAGCAPGIYLAATSNKALERVRLEDLKKHAIDLL